MIEKQQAPSEIPRGSRRWLWVIAGVVGFGILGLWLGGLFRPYVFSGTIIQSSAAAPSLSPLVYENGESADLESLHGDVVLIYFGYTHCPDLCPAMLSTVDRALGTLGEPAERVTTMMVTVDPSRDSQAYVGEYVTLFNEEFRGVWGTEDEVRSVATKYGVFFEHDAPDEEGNYLVGHTASLMAVDPEGALRLVYPVGVTAAELERDLRELLR